MNRRQKRKQRSAIDNAFNVTYRMHRAKVSSAREVNFNRIFEAVAQDFDINPNTVRKVVKGY